MTPTAVNGQVIIGTSDCHLLTGQVQCIRVLSLGVLARKMLLTVSS